MLINEIVQEKTYVTRTQLERLEKYLDKIFALVGIDVDLLGQHFFERLNDSRNISPITIPELRQMFQDAYNLYGRHKVINKLGPEAQAVLYDIETDINLPFILKWDPGTRMFDLVAKTVMRKKNFKTNDPVLKV